MRYIWGLFWAFIVSAQTVVLTDPSQFRHRTRLIDFESTPTGEPLHQLSVIGGTNWASLGVYLRKPQHYYSPYFQLLRSPYDPSNSVVSGNLSLWQHDPGYLLITFPGANLPAQRQRVLRSPGAFVYQRGITREFGVWVINGRFRRHRAISPYEPIFGSVSFYDGHGQMITNVITGGANTFVGLRHPPGIGAVLIEHSTLIPIIDDIYVGRVFRTKESLLDVNDLQ